MTLQEAISTIQKLVLDNEYVRDVTFQTGQESTWVILHHTTPKLRVLKDTGFEINETVSEDILEFIELYL